jgi:hypothetical protein
MFVTGVSVGAVASIGAIVGGSLIALNRLTDGEVAKVFGIALGDVKDILLDKDKER